MKKLLAAIALAAVVLGLAQSFDTVSTRVTRIETRRAVKSIEINFTPDGKFQDAMVYIVDRVVDTNGAVVYAETPGVSKQLDRQWMRRHQGAPGRRQGPRVVRGVGLPSHQDPK